MTQLTRRDQLQGLDVTKNNSGGPGSVQSLIRRHLQKSTFRFHRAPIVLAFSKTTLYSSRSSKTPFALGTAGGVVIGLAVVAILCWRETRLQPSSSPPAPASDQAASSGSVARQLLLTTGALLVLGLCLSSGVVVGRLIGEWSGYHRRYLEEQETLAPAIAADPAFKGVEICERSNGGVYLMGDVPTPADLDRLRGVVIRAIGETRGREAMSSVYVKR